ncbi:hypothetical protein BN1723_016750 [Verticillium longisporum]|uniref:homogentisate 1,2-dioxygenase n=1 Tax=Verticillium longisporum TaxID=100787 RepID=A0A0G4NLT9_VERLO|nr:hypothetical protein BN1723_016750 [Verticillium longisporum]
MASTEDYQNIFHWAETQKDGSIPSFETRRNDPYKYMSGFNNSFESEAVPGVIPKGQNSPRSIRFGLYAEQMTASAFVAPRHVNKKAWLYRSRPAVAHQGFTDLPNREDVESNFLPINPRVHVSPTQLAWSPFDIPTDQDVDFIDGLKTLAGSGDPTLREGLATHVYLCNTSMKKRAFANSDGDFLIVPQQGALDIQTEFGFLYVQPGEICVIQRGQRFKVNVEGPTRGYILEIWGSNFELPELGPLGANGLANARDFLHPVAACILNFLYGGAAGAADYRLSSSSSSSFAASSAASSSSATHAAEKRVRALVLGAHIFLYVALRDVPPTSQLLTILCCRLRALLTELDEPPAAGVGRGALSLWLAFVGLVGSGGGHGGGGGHGAAGSENAQWFAAMFQTALRDTTPGGTLTEAGRRDLRATLRSFLWEERHCRVVLDTLERRHSVSPPPVVENVGVEVMGGGDE